VNGNFARLGTYLRFICRRERAASVIWVVCIAGLSTMFAALYPGLLPTQAAAAELAATMNNPAMVAMMGPVYGMENLTQASVMAQECLIWFFIIIAVMNIFLVNRHTRADEELGRLEMLCALPVGRLTCSLAAITFAFLANVLVSLMTAGLLLVLGIGGTTASGALAYGFAIGAVGFMFAGLTLLLAQLFSTAHLVSGVGLASLGLFYMLRALGDVRGNVVSDISPLGLGLKVEAFYRNDMAPVLIIVAEGVLLSVIALAICSVRDYGTGIIPARKGRANASRLLRSPLGFAWRVSTGTVLGWSAGLFLLGASFGSVCADINSFVENNEMMRDIIGAGGGNALLDGYVAMIFALMSIAVSVPAVLTVMKIRSEEKRGRLDQIFGRAVPRLKLYGAFIVVAIMESVVMEFLLAAGLAAAGGELALPALLKAGFSYLPATWVMTGVAVLLVGAVPKLSALVWAALGYSFVALYMGRVMDVPELIVKITPFGSIPQLPVQEFTAVPLIALTVTAAALAALGLWRFRERDIG
jgi:ABC-2 type transport system permease protein